MIVNDTSQLKLKVEEMPDYTSIRDSETTKVRSTNTDPDGLTN
jgi:hypothetical protein